MKMNFKNLTACLAISLGTVCAANAMNPNFGQEEQFNDQFNTIARTCFGDAFNVNTNDDINVINALISASSDMLKADGDAAIEDPDAVAEDIVTMAIYENEGINALTPLSVMARTDLELSNRRMQAIIQRVGNNGVLRPEVTHHQAFIDLYNNRVYATEAFVASMDNVIDWYASLYQMSIEEDPLFNNLPCGGVALEAFRSARSILNEVSTYMFIAIADAINSGRDYTHLINDFENMLLEGFNASSLRFTPFGFVRENLDQLRQHVRHMYGDLSINSPYRYAITNLMHRTDGTLQGAINAVNAACRRARGN